MLRSCSPTSGCRRSPARNCSADSSGCTRTQSQGTPLHVVSEILGHASITITKDVYGHQVEGDRRAVAASMSRALFGPERAAVAPNMAPTATTKTPPGAGRGVDLGALGGTRTPNLLIRRGM